MEESKAKPSKRYAFKTARMAQSCPIVDIELEKDYSSKKNLL